MVWQNRQHSPPRSPPIQEANQGGIHCVAGVWIGCEECLVLIGVYVCSDLYCACPYVQLVESEGVKVVVSYNEAYELRFFTNSKKVSY